MVQKYKPAASPEKKSAKRTQVSPQKKKTNQFRGKKQNPPVRGNFSDANKSNNTFKSFVKGKLRVMMLGGLEEVGRNMALIQYEKEILKDYGFVE